MERGEISGDGAGSGNVAGECRCWGRGEEKVNDVIRSGKLVAGWPILGFPLDHGGKQGWER